MPENIIELLKKNNGYYSGARISAELGISRTAVWKKIVTLRKKGFIIEAVPSKGYLLVKSPDLSAEYITGESHHYLGSRYLLKVIEHKAAPNVSIKHETMELYIRPNTCVGKRQSILDEWYRQRMKEIVPGYIAQYEKAMKVQVSAFGIKKMKTRWGTCGIRAKRIWLNLELAKKPIECVEYVVVHEMAHLLERNHDKRFTALMDRYLPKWRFYKEELNRRPLRHENWSY